MEEKEKNEKGVEITIRVKEKKENGKAEMRCQLCIPKMMQQRILHKAHDTAAGVDFAADRTYLCKKD